MMKIIEYFIRYILVIVLFVSCFVVNPDYVKATSSATTLAELRAELKALQAEKSANESKQQLTEAEIEEKNKQIASAYSEIEESKNKIALAEESIEASEQKIIELEEQMEQLMAFYQIMNGDNAYLEFVTDSASMTELIMRSDAIAQISSYTKNKLDEINELIEENEQLKVDLINYQEELNDNIVVYEETIEELDSELLSLEDLSMDIDDEIKVTKESIEMYEDLGCEEDEELTACITRTQSSSWLKPLVSGYVSSNFGYRTLNGKTSFHSGIDLGVKEGTTVYSATTGTVISIIKKSSCGGNQVFVQAVVDGEPYVVLYAHLLSISVKKGQTVTQDTIIGYSGGYSTSYYYGGYDTCTYGAHLHFSVSKGVYTTWSKFYANLINPPGFPSKGGRWYSRYTWFD